MLFNNVNSSDFRFSEQARTWIPETSATNPRKAEDCPIMQSCKRHKYGFTMAAIEIQGLTKSYQVGFWRKTEKLGLKDLTLSVEEGEVFGCLGPNGAGKTTTLKILMGLIFADSGSARILGREIGDPEMKRQIGYLPEHPYFYDYLTARELLEYYAGLSGMPASERGLRAQAMLEQVGLKDAADSQLRKFSKGMLQRCGIAQAIVHDPKLVFLDEPMSGLDPIGRREVRDLIQRLNDDGKTIFFSTHILSDAETLCDRICVLNNGELSGICAVADLQAKVRGKVEIIFEGARAAAKLKSISADLVSRTTGDSVRAVADESQVNAVLDLLRRENCRLVSVTPVQNTLEEYFLSHVSPADQKNAVEVQH